MSPRLIARRLAVAALLSVASGTAPAALIPIDYASPGDALLTRDTQTGLEWLDLTATIGAGNSVNSILAGLSSPSFVFHNENGGTVEIGGGRFRYATRDEVITLWQHAGVPPSAQFIDFQQFGSGPPIHTVTGDPALRAAVQGLQDLLGGVFIFNRSFSPFGDSSEDGRQSDGVYLAGPGVFNIARLLDKTSEDSGLLSSRETTEALSEVDQIVGLDPAAEGPTQTFGNFFGFLTFPGFGHYLVRTTAANVPGASSVPAPGTALLLAAAALACGLARRRRGDVRAGGQA